MAKLKYSAFAYVHCFSIGLNNEKQCFHTIRVPCRMDGRVLFNGHWRKPNDNGKIKVEGLEFTVNGHHLAD